MFRVKTYLAPSAIEGIGVFAGEDIKKGTVTWEVVEGFDQIFDEAHFNALPTPAQDYVRKHAFWHKGKIILSGDHGNFVNHSADPNEIGWPDADSLTGIAARDIKKGEEITCDYKSFDEAAAKKLG